MFASWIRRCTVVVIATLPAVIAEAQLSPEAEAKIASTVQQIVQQTGIPSASVGVLEDGRIVYTHAFGMARLQPPVPATASMA